jgi:hypothetical protein
VDGKLSERPLQRMFAYNKAKTDRTPCAAKKALNSLACLELLRLDLVYLNRLDAPPDALKIIHGMSQSMNE